jgi:citrate synthase
MEPPAADRSDAPLAPKGLKGLVVADTDIGDVRGEEGFYHYGPYSAVDLATSRPFEDVWHLLLVGHLPDAPTGDAFARDVARRRPLPDGLVDVVDAVVLADRTTAVFDQLRTGLSAVAARHAMRPMLDLDESRRLDDALTLVAVAPTLLATIHRRTLALPAIAPRHDLGHVANLLWMFTGTEPEPIVVRALEAYLVSTIDHGFNASTFTARVVASTGADLGACAVAAMGALSGPLHGGAPSRALDLLEEIGDRSRIDEVIVRRLEAGERLMGFGHAVYRTDDPRSLMLRDIAVELGGPLVDLAVEVEDRALALLAEHRPGRPLRTNVEFYAGVVMRTCGIPPELFTPLFATSRLVGWCAHALEQARSRTIIRPSARYTGPSPVPQPVPTR